MIINGLLFFVLFTARYLFISHPSSICWFNIKIITSTLDQKLSLYSGNVKRRIRNTNVLGVRLSVPKGAYAVTAGAGCGTTIRVAAAPRGYNAGNAVYGLSKGFRVAVGYEGSGGTKENGDKVKIEGKKGFTGGKNEKGKDCAEQGEEKLNTNANKTNINKTNM